MLPSVPGDAKGLALITGGLEVRAVADRAAEKSR